MEAFWWLFAIVLMALGLIGTVIPIVPGTTIILAAAVVHRVALGADRSLGMSALITMLVLTLVTYAIDAAAGFLGAKRFGATKWGLIGGAAGALLGLFFGLLGLFVGPVIGAIAGEIIGGKEVMKAGRAGWGTFLGGLAGVIAKLFIGLIMIVIFLMNVPSPLYLSRFTRHPERKSRDPEALPLKLSLRDPSTALGMTIGRARLCRAGK